MIFREQLRGVLEIFDGGDHVDQITSRQHKLGIPDDQEISDHDNVIGDLDDNPINQSFENYRDGRTGDNEIFNF